MSLMVIECPTCHSPVIGKREAPGSWRGAFYTCPTCLTQTEDKDLLRKHRFSIARGARGKSHLGGGLPMGIGRAPLGTSSGTNSGTTLTLLSGVTLATGDTLVVFIANDVGVGSNIQTMTWNGNAMTFDNSVATIAIGASTGWLDAFYLQNATAGTGNIVLDLTVTGALSSWQAFATRITAVAASSKDRSNASTGTSASPTSTATAATRVVNELLVGCVAWANNAISGSWSNSFTAGQSSAAANGFCIEEGFLVVLAKAAYTAAKTGATNTDWAAGIITFKER